MAFRHFPTWTQTDLEAQLLELDKALMDGTQSGSTGDASATNRSPAEIESVREKILHDLRVLDSATYASSQPIRRTAPKYT